MSYLAFCTFDLKGASTTDYANAYSDLKAIGLKRVIERTGSTVVIPTTSVMGEFEGSSGGVVRDQVRTAVKTAFQARGFKSEIFVVVGTDWAWGANTT